MRATIFSRIAGFEVISSHPKAALRLVKLVVPLALLVASNGVGSAADVKAGRAKALMCQACHGIDGLSKVPDAPNIAGQTESYLITQLQAFKSGARKSDAMSLVAPSLSDSDVEDLAAYFSAIEVKIVKIPGD
jgi:cytochrome c553